MNSVIRDKTKTIVFDDLDNDHPYRDMIERIKELMALKNIDEITNNTALYELYKILNNIILSSPPITKYDNIVLYRGERAYIDDLMNHNINDIYVNTGIWSTSLDPYTANKFAGAFSKTPSKGYVINILIPAVLDNGKNAHILPIKDCSMEEDEFEILLPNGCTFMVIDKITEKSKGPNEITLVLVDQPDKEITILKK